MPTLPTHYLDCVVSLGSVAQENNYIPEASGFFYGQVSEGTKDYTDDKEAKYEGYLVTNRHVLKDRDFIGMRLNRIEGSHPNYYVIPRNDKKDIERWHFHPDPEIDIAIIEMSSPQFVGEEIDFNYFREDQVGIKRAEFVELGISDGDLVYALGFPMGLTGEDRNYTIVRSGSIARISDYLRKSSKSFLVDCFVFPGNSGGPLVLRPSVASIDKKPISRAYLLGVVASYIPYIDVAYSAQTGRERIRFQENSGLTKIIPIEFVNEAIEDYISKKGSSTDD